MLPNAWDAESARLVAEAGFPVIATSSSAVAASLGVHDGDVMEPDLAFGAIAREVVQGTPLQGDKLAKYNYRPQNDPLRR